MGDDRQQAVGHVDVGSDRPSPIDEQLHRRGTAGGGEVVVVGGQVERGDADDRLVGEAKRLAGRDEERPFELVAEHVVDDGGDRVEDVLGVVDDDEVGRSDEPLGHAIGRIAYRGLIVVGADDGVGEPVGDRGRVRDAGEVDERHRPPLDRPPSHREGERRLADAAGSEQGDEGLVGDVLADGGDEVVGAPAAHLGDGAAPPGRGSVAGGSSIASPAPDTCHTVIGSATSRSQC